MTLCHPPRLPLLALAACLLPTTPAAWAQTSPPPDPVEATAGPGLAEAYGELASGRARAAEQAFLALAADAASDDAGPLLGAGLASVVAGDADRAVQRIRAALVRGPSAFEALPGGGEALAGRLRGSRETLEAGLLDSDDPTGVLVASAALDYLLGELPTARLSLATAIRRDGLQPPMRTLDRLIQHARFVESEGGFVAPVFAGAGPALPVVVPDPGAAPAPAATAPNTPPAPVSAEPAEAPRLIRPVGPGAEAERAEVFLDYEKLNQRVNEMAGSLESFQDKLFQSLMRRPGDTPQLPPADPGGVPPEATPTPAAPGGTPRPSPMPTPAPTPADAG